MPACALLLGPGSARRSAPLPGMTRVWARARSALASRRCRPRVWSRRERGRRSAAIRCNKRAALRRPRRLLAVPRVRSHRQRAFGPALASLGRASRVQDLELLRALMHGSAAARRASVQTVASAAQPRSAAPESEAELSLASDARDGTDASLNRAPPPPRVGRSADASHTGRGEGSMGAVRRRGD